MIVCYSVNVGHRTRPKNIPFCIVPSKPLDSLLNTQHPPGSPSNAFQATRRPPGCPAPSWLFGAILTARPLPRCSMHVLVALCHLGCYVLVSPWYCAETWFVVRGPLATHFTQDVDVSTNACATIHLSNLFAPARSSPKRRLTGQYIEDHLYFQTM